MKGIIRLNWPDGNPMRLRPFLFFSKTHNATIFAFTPPLPRDRHSIALSSYPSDRPATIAILLIVLYYGK
jgi:hypothetical protein